MFEYVSLKTASFTQLTLLHSRDETGIPVCYDKDPLSTLSGRAVIAQQVTQLLAVYIHPSALNYGHCGLMMPKEVTKVDERTSHPSTP